MLTDHEPTHSLFHKNIIHETIYFWDVKMKVVFWKHAIVYRCMSKHKHNWLNFLYESVKKPNEIEHEFFHEDKKNSVCWLTVSKHICNIAVGFWWLWIIIIQEFLIYQFPTDLTKAFMEITSTSTHNLVEKIIYKTKDIQGNNWYIILTSSWYR